jgi:hypothetical protein
LIIAARKMGIDVEATCREAEVEAPRIERGELAIEPSSLFGFLTALDQKATSSPLGLAAAEALSQAELAFLDDGPPIAANLGEATARVIELFPLATRTSALRLEEHGREVVLVLETSSPSPAVSPAGISRRWRSPSATAAALAAPTSASSGRPSPSARGATP